MNKNKKVLLDGAAASLAGLSGEAARVAGPLEFAATIIELLDDPALRMKLSSRGREYVELNHDWNDIAAELEDVYLEVSGSIR